MGENGLPHYRHNLDTGNMEVKTEGFDFNEDIDMWYDNDSQDGDESYAENGGNYNGDVYNDGHYDVGDYNDGDYNEGDYNDGDYDDNDCVVLFDEKEESFIDIKPKPGPASSKPGPASSKPSPASSKPGPASSKMGPTSSNRGRKVKDKLIKSSSTNLKATAAKQIPPSNIFHEGYTLWLSSPSHKIWRSTFPKAPYMCQEKSINGHHCRGKVFLWRRHGAEWTNEQKVWIEEVRKHNHSSELKPPPLRPHVDPRDGFVIFGVCGRIMLTTDLRQQNPKTCNNCTKWHNKFCSEPDCKEVFVVETEKQKAERMTLGKSRQVICWLCHAEYPTLQLIRQHVNDKHLGRKFICEVCQVKIPTFGELRAHYETHDGFISFRMTFERSLEDIDYQLIAPEAEFECDICHSDTKFRVEKDLLNHKDIVHFGRVIMCVQCGKTYKKSKSWGFDHKIFGRDCHGKFVVVFDKPLEEESPLLQYDGCDKCDRKWGGTKDAGWSCLRHHFNNEHRGRTFKCRVCFKDLGPLSSLLEHAESHDEDAAFDAIYAHPEGVPGGKPVSMEHSTSSVDNRPPQLNPLRKLLNSSWFSKRQQSEEIKSPEVVVVDPDEPANGDKSTRTQSITPSSILKPKTLITSPRSCPTCDATFLRVDDIFRSHLLRHAHKPPEDEPVCPKCDLEFADRELMVDHFMLAHGGVDRIYCEFPSCPESFRTQQELVAHRLEIHGNS